MKQKKGFTIIELSLSIAFIAVLLVGIASIVINMTSVYQKGLTLKAINATGQQIIEDMQRSINSATYNLEDSLGDDRVKGAPLTKNDYKEAMTHYFYEKTNNNKQVVGIFCIGNYTYLWNTAEALQDGSEEGITINNGGVSTKPRLARFLDHTHKECDVNKDGSIAHEYENGVQSFDLSNDVVDLIQQDETDIALYDFRVSPAVQSVNTGQLFMSAAFILATRRGGVNINSNGDYCKGSDSVGEDEFSKYDFDYCAVNKFNFSMRTGGIQSDKKGGR